MKEPAEILLDLVAIPSVSPMCNQPVIDYAVRYLGERDWTFQPHPYIDPAGVSKNNLVALTRNATGNRAELALVCHTDTVPFDPAWTEAVHPKIAGGKLYGRGSCDIKGFLACALAALQDVDVNALAKPVALVLTADEEIGCVGAKHLAAIEAFRAAHAIIGEPTGLHPVRAGKGYALATITLTGKEAHSAFPSKGRSAIFDAARVLLGLERLARELETVTCNPAFDPPFTTLNAGVVAGGTAKNIVPGECQITVEWRPVPGQSADSVDKLIEDLLRELAAAHPGLQASLTVHRVDPAFAPSRSTRAADLLSELSGKAATAISFGSEAAHLAPLATEVVVFGAGDMTVAHKTGEHVDIEELRQCAGYLGSAVRRICSVTE